MKKKIVLGLGAVASVTAPIAAVVACNNGETPLSFDKISLVDVVRVASEKGLFNMPVTSDDEQEITWQRVFENLGANRKGYLGYLLNEIDLGDLMTNASKDVKIGFVTLESALKMAIAALHTDKIDVDFDDADELRTAFAAIAKSPEALDAWKTLLDNGLFNVDSDQLNAIKAIVRKFVTVPTGTTGTDGLLNKLLNGYTETLDENGVPTKLLRSVASIIENVLTNTTSSLKEDIQKLVEELKDTSLTPEVKKEKEDKKTSLESIIGTISQASKMVEPLLYGLFTSFDGFFNVIENGATLKAGFEDAINQKQDGGEILKLYKELKANDEWLSKNKIAMFNGSGILDNQSSVEFKSNIVFIQSILQKLRMLLFKTTANGNAILNLVYPIDKLMTESLITILKNQNKNDLIAKIEDVLTANHLDPKTTSIQTLMSKITDTTIQQEITTIAQDVSTPISIPQILELVKLAVPEQASMIDMIANSSLLTKFASLNLREEFDTSTFVKTDFEELNTILTKLVSEYADTKLNATDLEDMYKILKDGIRHSADEVSRVATKLISSLTNIPSEIEGMIKSVLKPLLFGSSSK